MIIYIKSYALSESNGIEDTLAKKMALKIKKRFLQNTERSQYGGINGTIFRIFFLKKKGIRVNQLGVSIIMVRVILD